MYTKRLNFSNSSMCDAFGAAYTSVRPNSFNNSATLSCTALFAVLILFFSLIKGHIGIPICLVLLSVIAGVANIKKLHLNK